MKPRLKAANQAFLLISPVFPSANYVQFKNVPPLKPKAFGNGSLVNLLKINFIFVAQFHFFIFCSCSKYGSLENVP